VYLKGILRQVNADSRDLHLGGSKFGLRDSTIVALRRREREPSTRSALVRSIPKSSHSAFGQQAWDGAWT
jgi:hypothetical protein